MKIARSQIEQQIADAPSPAAPVTADVNTPIDPDSQNISVSLEQAYLDELQTLTDELKEELAALLRQTKEDTN